MTGARSAPRLVVAIDGPAGAGKSTAARILAARLGVPFVDTGAMYRAAALFLEERNVDPDDDGAISAALPELDLELVNCPDRAEIRLNGLPVEARIRTPEISALTSRIARHGGLRRRLVELQREFVGRHGGVMEGRDIGTVVVPETPFKFYLDATPETRAERRHAELAARGVEGDVAEIARQIADRDRRDQTRAASPLTAAPDAVRLSSEGLTVDEVVERLDAEIARISVR